ncbi:hypothetical protein V6N13_036445 [Hibiscus sabdariffa]
MAAKSSGAGERGKPAATLTDEEIPRNNRKMASQPAVLPIVEGQVATVVSRKA